jgi:hypothetical protein
MAETVEKVTKFEDQEIKSVFKSGSPEYKYQKIKVKIDEAKALREQQERIRREQQEQSLASRTQ